MHLIVRKIWIIFFKSKKIFFFYLKSICKKLIIENGDLKLKDLVFFDTIENFIKVSRLKKWFLFENYICIGDNKIHFFFYYFCFFYSFLIFFLTFLRSLFLLFRCYLRTVRFEFLSGYEGFFSFLIFLVTPESWKKFKRKIFSIEFIKGVALEGFIY